MKRYFLVTLSLIVVLGIIFSGCSSISPAPSSKSLTPSPSATTAPPASSIITTQPAMAAPIKIGAIMSLTGEDAVVGAGVKAALDYGLEKAGGQVAGRKIQLVAEDDGTNPTMGVDKAKKLVNFDKIDVLIGPLHGAVTMGVANFMSSVGVPEILLMQKSIQAIQFGGKNVFLPFGTHMGTGYYLGAYAYEKKGYKTATALFEDFVAGQEFVGGTIAGFEKKGGTVIQKQAIKSGTMDFGPYLTAVQNADCVFFWFTPATTMKFVAQYYAAGLKMPLFLSLSSVLFAQTMASVGDKVVGILGAGPYTSLLDTPINKSYVDAMSKKYNVLPDAQVVSAEVALTMYLEAVKATNGDTSPAKVNEALRKLKVSTPAGSFSFTPEGLGVGDLYIMQTTKTPDRFDWKVVDTYSQIQLDVPK